MVGLVKFLGEERFVSTVGAGIDARILPRIPTDEIVDAMAQTAQLMSPLLKESAKGGLAKTKTAIELERNKSMV